MSREVRTLRKGVVVAFWRAWVLLVWLSAGALWGSAEPPRKILVLLSYHDSLPWTKSYKQGLSEAQAVYGDRVEFFVENMESIRLEESLSDARWAAYLKEKYRSVRFDGIIAESDRASRFMMENRDALFGPIPFAFYMDVKGEQTFPAAMKIVTGPLVEKTVELAFSQNPDARRAIVIDGKNRSSDSMLALLLPLLQERHPDVAVEVVREFTIEELEERLRTLPEQSVVFYNLIFRDRTGKAFVPKEALRGLAKESAAPIYTFFGSLMGSGTVGGHMSDGAVTALQSVRAVMDFLDGKPRPGSYLNSQTWVDWRAMERYGIDPQTIPAGAEILNRPVSIFEAYFWEATITALFVVLLLVLLALAVTLNIRRKQLIGRLEESNKAVVRETQRRMEKERLLIQQSKMAAMGEMIGSIAHQWKQPLNALSLTGGELVDQVEFGEMTPESAREIEEAVHKQVEFMNRTIQDFRDFFRPDKERKRFALCDAFGRVLRILQKTLDKEEIAVTLPEAPIEVTTVQNELEQVFLNLLVNAKDALAQREGERWIRISCAETETESRIAIRDNGGGIPEENLEKIFNSYFSTKGEQGSGIGLYMSRLIVEESLGGKLLAENREGGACFTIVLPRNGEEGSP